MHGFTESNVGRRHVDAGRRPITLAVIILHGLLFVLGAFLVLASASSFSGSNLAATAVPALAVVAAGAARASRQVCGGRALLVVGDVGLGLALAVSRLDPPPFDRGMSPVWVLGATLLAVVAAASTRLLAAGSIGSIDRSRALRRLPVGIVALDVASIVALIASTPTEVSSASIFVPYAASVLLGDAIVLAAWWWACRWPVGFIALAAAGVWSVSILLIPGVGTAAGLQLVLAIGAIALAGAAVVIGPRLVDPSDGDPAAAVEPARLPVAAVVWLVVAAALYLLLLLPSFGWGTSDLCFPCIPHTTIDEVVVWFAFLCGLLIPLAAVVAVVARGRPSPPRPLAIWLLATGGILTGAIAAGMLGRGYFEGFRYEIVPVALVLAAGVLAWRPAIAPRAGWAIGLAAVGAAGAWLWTSAVPSFGDIEVTALGALPAGLVLPILMAREGDRAARLVQLSTARTAERDPVLDVDPSPA